MSELHFVRVEGDSMVLRSADGEEFVVPLDDVVRSEVKRQNTPSAGKPTISPREIQEAIRAGSTIEQIASENDAEVAYVEKFARPVLDELQHVVAAAQAVRIQLAGDRFSEVTQIDFGDLVSRRLEAGGSTQESWTSKRIDVNNWLVTVTFEMPSGPGHAAWTFDPRKLVLTPENETALALSSAESLSAGPIPRLRPVTAKIPTLDQTASSQASAPSSPAASPTTPVQPATHTLTTVRRAAEDLPTAPLASQESPAPVRSTIKEAIAKATEVSDVPAAEPVGTETSSINSIELLDVLRQKRQEREAAKNDELPHKVSGAERPLIPVAEPEPVTSAIRIINDSPLVEPEDSQLPEVEPEDVVFDEPQSADDKPQTAPAQKAEPKKSRSAIPSWDEIVFGTKTDEN